MSGQVIIVTGGNSGIGRETCKALLNKGAKVYLAARNKSKAEEAIEWLKNETGGKTAVFLQLDLANLDSIRKAAAEYKEKEQELHVLFNNGGVMSTPLEMKTANGYDAQFGTNVLGHYLFTMLLLPVLIHTAKNSQVADGCARVVNTASGAHWLAPKGGINYATLEPNSSVADEARKKMGYDVLYAQSKWGNIVFSKELDRRYGAQGIVSTAIQPGVIETELTRNRSMNSLESWYLSLISWPTPLGALTQLYAGTTPEGREFHGKYLIPWGRLAEPRWDTKNEEAGKKLWAWLEEQVKQN